jgi:ABC-type phosphate transport system substrate-binding protein
MTIIHEFEIHLKKCNFAQKIDHMGRITTFLSICIAFTIMACNGGNKDETKNNPQKSTVNNDLEAGKITIGATEESYDLAQRIASNYIAQNTNLIVEVIPCKINEAKQMIAENKVQLIVTGGSSNPFPDYESTIIATDLLLLTVNFNNPALQYLVMRGLDLKDLSGIFCTGTINNWNQVDKKSESTPLKPLAGPDSSSSNNMVRSFLKSNLAPTVTSSMSENELTSSVSASPGSIVFMSHRMTYNQNSGVRANGIYIIPVDFDGNNVANDSELIYDNLNMLKKAYNKGGFPKSLVRNHYFIANGKAERSDIVKHFTHYAQKEASNVISGAGYFQPLK